LIFCSKGNGKAETFSPGLFPFNKDENEELLLSDFTMVNALCGLHSQAAGITGANVPTIKATRSCNKTFPRLFLWPGLET